MSVRVCSIRHYKPQRRNQWTRRYRKLRRQKLTQGPRKGRRVQTKGEISLCPHSRRDSGVRGRVMIGADVHEFVFGGEGI